MFMQETILKSNFYFLIYGNGFAVNLFLFVLCYQSDDAANSGDFVFFSSKLDIKQKKTANYQSWTPSSRDKGKANAYHSERKENI